MDHQQNILLLNNKKEWTVDTHHNTDPLQKNYADWKKSGSKGYILNTLIYMTSMWQNYRNKQEMHSFQGLLVEVRFVDTWGDDGTILYSDFLLSLFSCSVTSGSLWPHGLQHTRLLCPPPSPRVHSNSHQLSQWGYNLSQQQVSSSYQVGKVLELQLRHQSFQWIFRVDFL